METSDDYVLGAWKMETSFDYVLGACKVETSDDYVLGACKVETSDDYVPRIMRLGADLRPATCPPLSWFNCEESLYVSV